MPPTPTTVREQNPLVYAFDNICDPAQPNSPGTYHVTLDGPQSTQFDVPPNQQSVNGTLPPGQYVIGWTPDHGAHEQFTYSSDQGPYAMTFCGKP